MSTRGYSASHDLALGNLSLAYQQLEQWSEAETAIAQSLNLLQTTKNTKDSSQILAQVLDIKGRLQLAQSKAEDALDTWRVSLDIYTKIGDERAAIQNRINQAQALQTLGFYRQAEKTLRETTQILQSQPNSPVKVAALHSLGNVVQVTGDLETSRQILQQSLEIPSSLQDLEAIADILLSLGNTARVQQDTQTAIKYYQQTIKTATSPTTRIQAEANQLRLLLKTEQLSAFQTLSSQIKTQLHDLPVSRTAISARINFAQSLMQFRKKTAADTDSWLDIVSPDNAIASIGNSDYQQTRILLFLGTRSHQLIVSLSEGRRQEAEGRREPTFKNVGLILDALWKSATRLDTILFINWAITQN